MEQSFELASTTAVSLEALRATDTRGIRGPLFNHYVQRDFGVAPAALLGNLAEVGTLEEQVRSLGRNHRALFTLAHVFRASLDRPQMTNVPGHGTVSDIGVADGDLGIQGNLLVEGKLLVAGDLSVGGQLVTSDDAIVIVTGSLHTSALAGAGQLCVGRDLRAMFIEVNGAETSLDVNGVLDSFLLIHQGHIARAAEFSVGLHAVCSDEVTTADVFLSTMLDAEGKPDWTAIARAAKAGDDVFRDDYHTPAPARDSWVQQI